MLWLDFELSLGEVVDAFGPPESIYATIESGESLGYLIIFYYPTRGLEFHSFSCPVSFENVVIEDGVGILHRELVVERVSYHAPASLDTVLQQVFRYPPSMLNVL